MKSLLVDALRQAQGDASAEDPGADEHNQSAVSCASDLVSASPDQTLTAASAELDLLMTGAYASDDSQASLAPDEDVAAQRQRSQEETVSEQSEQALSAPGAATKSGDESVDRAPLVMRAARFSPLICLLALCSTAAAYFVLHNLAALDLNVDLTDMASRGGSAAEVTGSAADSRALPATGLSIFENFNNELPVQSRTGNLAALREQSQTVLAAPAVQARQATAAPVAQGFIAAQANTDTFNDLAHASVLAAFSAYQAGDYEIAEGAYLQALNSEPNHTTALAGMAAVYLQTGRNGQALHSYEKLLEIDPGSTLAAAAILSLRANDPGWNSESELKLLLQRFPDAHHLHYALGTVFVAQQRWPNAKQAFLAAHHLAPDNANYSYNVAVSMEKIGEHEAARTYYVAALATAGPDSKIDRNAVSAHLERTIADGRDRL